MTLVNDTSSLTPAQKSATQLRLIATNLFNELRRQYVAAYNLVWHNSSGLTPQQVCDSLGTDAAHLFAASTATVSVLLVSTPSAAALEGVPLEVPAGWSYTANEDGTVTLVHG